MNEKPLHQDRLNHAPDSAETALILIDVINPIDFEGGERLLVNALPMAKSLVELKRRTKAAKIPVIYVNDNFGRWRSDFRRVVEECLEQGVLGKPISANDAYMRGFRLIIPSDCTASEKSEQNEQVLELMCRGAEGRCHKLN